MVLEPLGAADHGDLDQGAGDDGERGQDDGREDPGPLADVARPGGSEEEGAPRPPASPPEFTKTQRSHTLVFALAGFRVAITPVSPP